MYPRRSNTIVKGGPSLNAPTHSPPHPDNEPVSLTPTHTQSYSHAQNVYYVQTQIRGSPPVRREGQGVRQGDIRGPVSGRKPAEP